MVQHGADPRVLHQVLPSGKSEMRLAYICEESLVKDNGNGFRLYMDVICFANCLKGVDIIPMTEVK